MWIVCITSVRHVLTVNGYGGRQTKENEKSWCFKGWETLVILVLLPVKCFCLKWLLVPYYKSFNGRNKNPPQCFDYVFQPSTNGVDG